MFGVSVVIGGSKTHLPGFSDIHLPYHGPKNHGQDHPGFAYQVIVLFPMVKFPKAVWYFCPGS